MAMSTPVPSIAGRYTFVQWHMAMDTTEVYRNLNQPPLRLRTVHERTGIPRELHLT